jgi:hypothetical protein
VRSSFWGLAANRLETKERLLGDPYGDVPDSTTASWHHWSEERSILRRSNRGTATSRLPSYARFDSEPREIGEHDVRQGLAWPGFSSKGWRSRLFRAVMPEAEGIARPGAVKRRTQSSLQIPQRAATGVADPVATAADAKVSICLWRYTSPGQRRNYSSPMRNRLPPPGLGTRRPTQ